MRDSHSEGGSTKREILIWLTCYQLINLFCSLRYDETNPIRTDSHPSRNHSYWDTPRGSILHFNPAAPRSNPRLRTFPFLSYWCACHTRCMRSTLAERHVHLAANKRGMFGVCGPVYSGNLLNHRPASIITVVLVEKQIKFRVTCPDCC